jgi:phosphatidate cytidylyltransferase
MSPHIKRWITGVVAVPILFVIIYFGSELVFAVFITVIILGAAVEYNRMIFRDDYTWERWESLTIALVIPLTVYFGDTHVVLATVTLLVLAVFAIFLLRIRNNAIDIIPVSKIVLGFMYIPLTLSSLILLRRCEDGILWIFFILVLAFSGDIAAYYVGRTLGKRKLLPRVSPGKTVEGTLGLCIGSVLGCVLFRNFLYPALPSVHAVIIGFVGGILGQLGDLCESAIKRSAGVKDSGTLLLGHGGLLDRLDCLIFIAPFVYYYRLLFVA